MMQWLMPQLERWHLVRLRGQRRLLPREIDQIIETVISGYLPLEAT